MNKNDKKILVIGAASINHDQMISITKSFGISSKRLEIVSEYKRISHFDFNKLRYSEKYCGVIYGPCPHKCKGSEGYSSPVAMMEREYNCFPRIVRALTNGTLKITKTSFSYALAQLI